MTDRSGSGSEKEPEDRQPDPTDELLLGARWFAAELARCLLAAAVIAFGFFAIANVGRWPWTGAAVAFVVVASAAATIMLRSPLWITVAVGVFVLLEMAPRSFVPSPALGGGPVPLVFDQQSGWITAAMAAGLAAWFAMTVAERISAGRRAIRSWRRRDR